MEERFLKYMLDNDRLPNKSETFEYIAQMPIEELQSRAENTFWLYKPFRVESQYKNQMITECIKNELNFFVNDLDFNKTELEDFVLNENKKAITILRKEMKKQIKIYDKLVNEK